MLINRTLDNRYTIMERIGGGGMADVYRAMDNLLDRSVAVKVLHTQFAADDDFVRRFRREGQAAAKLSHPNIVNIYDVGQDDDIYYIVMEYIAGETLKEKIQRNGHLPVESALHIALQIAEALEHAHQNNLVHCDIKPHNILITSSGRVKVTDFGIARAATSVSMTQTGTVIGSVHYFSPEQAKGSVINAKSDLYSLGVVMYEMLTGQVPFTGENPISIALKHIQDEPRRPSELNVGIPPLVEAIVLKAMAKDPAQRYNSAAEMIKDIHYAQNYLQDEQTRRLARDDFPTQVLTPVTDGVGNKSGGKPPAKPPGRRKRRWPLIGALLALLLLGFAFGAFMAYGKFWSTSDVVVPNVVGKSVDEARTILINNKLRVNITEAYSDKVPVGYVISQSPEAGTTVKEQRIVTLVVSKGTEMVVVPDLRGLAVRDAELQLKNTGLVPGREDTQYSNDYPAGTVIGQNPRPPAQVAKGTAVDLVISKGPAPKKVTLPDFRGAAVATVSTQLDSLKLKIGKVTEQVSDKYPSGTIIDQNPPPGTAVDEGSSIDFTVAKNSSATTKRAVVQITVPEGPIRQAIQIVVNDDNGRRVVYDEVHKPGEHISRTVEGVGNVRVQVYINGTLIQEQNL